MAADKKIHESGSERFIPRKLHLLSSFISVIIIVVFFSVFVDSSTLLLDIATSIVFHQYKFEILFTIFFLSIGRKKVHRRTKQKKTDDNNNPIAACDLQLFHIKINEIFSSFFFFSSSFQVRIILYLVLCHRIMEKHTHTPFTAGKNAHWH